MSSLINKAKAALSKDKSDDPRSDNYGPHSTNVANSADPRVDSDLDHRNNPNVGYGQSNIGGGAYTGTGSTTVGPHSSNLANKADPRVDSDLDRGHHNTATHTTGGYGSTGTGIGGGSAGGYGSSTGAGYGSSNTQGSTNAGPHNSNLLNKLDPRVDSDVDGRNNPNSSYGSTTSGGAYTGTTHSGSTNAGPHSSNFANKIDPRVDSDRDNRNDPTSRVGGYGQQEGYGIQGSNPAPSSGYAPTHHQSTAGGYGTGAAGGYDNTGSYGTGSSGLGHSGPTGTHVGHNTNTQTGYAGGVGAGSGAAYGSSATPGSGDANRTAGPHNSNLLNKLDPRVDSDADGSKTYGGNQTYR